MLKLDANIFRCSFTNTCTEYRCKYFNFEKVYIIEKLNDCILMTWCNVSDKISTLRFSLCSRMLQQRLAILSEAYVKGLSSYIYIIHVSLFLLIWNKVIVIYVEHPHSTHNRAVL